jgi:hypothetical protein
MREITLKILVVLVFAISVSAQIEKPLLIEEVVGYENSEMTAARLDNLIRSHLKNRMINFTDGKT